MSIQKSNTTSYKKKRLNVDFATKLKTSYKDQLDCPVVIEDLELDNDASLQ